MAYVDIGDAVTGTKVTETYLDQVRANFQAGVPDIFTTKGDIAGASAADTAARLAVGANDSTLVADSAAATGLAWQIQPAARVYRTTVQTISAAWVAVAFDAERYDTDTMHEGVTNPSRITVPTNGGGIYHIGANIEFADPAAGTQGMQVRFLLNGTTVIAQSGKQYRTSGGGALAINQGCDYSLSATDYVQAQVYADAALNVLSSGNYSPEFWAIWQRRQ